MRTTIVSAMIDKPQLEADRVVEEHEHRVEDVDQRLEDVRRGGVMLGGVAGALAAG